MVWVFVRLKLALMRSGFSSSPASAVVYVLGTLLSIAAGCLMGLTISQTLGPDSELGTIMPVVLFIGVWLIWILGPLLNSAQGDQTIDPGRLELLPLSRGTQVSGLLISGLVGPAALGTLLGGLGGAFAAGLTIPAVGVIVLCAVLLVFMCLAWSRAVGALFVGVLSSRRGRDLTIALSGALGIGIYVLSESINTELALLTTAKAEGASLALTALPPAALAQAGIEATQGEWLLTIALLLWGVVGVGIALLIWRWALARRLDGGGDPRQGAKTESALVRADILYPRLVSWLPRSALGAVAAKELRYFFFRSTLQLQQIAVGTVVALILVAQTIFSDEPSLLTNYIGAFAVFMVLWQSAPNTFGIDNSAVSVYILSGVRLREILLGKMLALLILGLPLGIIIQIGAAIVQGSWETLPVSLAVVAIPWLVWLGLGSQLSVRAAFPLIPGHKPNSSVAIGAVLGGLLGAALIAAALIAAGVSVASLTGYAWAGVCVAWILAAGIGYAGFRNATRALESDPADLLQRLESNRS
jgi:ABC-2 type transport system permease protein